MNSQGVAVFHLLSQLHNASQQRTRQTVGKYNSVATHNIKLTLSQSSIGMARR